MNFIYHIRSKADHVLLFYIGTNDRNGLLSSCDSLRSLLSSSFHLLGSVCSNYHSHHRCCSEKRREEPKSNLQVVYSAASLLFVWLYDDVVQSKIQSKLTKCVIISCFVFVWKYAHIMCLLCILRLRLPPLPRLKMKVQRCECIHIESSLLCISLLGTELTFIFSNLILGSF